MSTVGQIIGVLVAAVVGGALSGFVLAVVGVEIANIPGLVLAIPGFAIAFVLVKFVLWRVESLRPVLAWLYPYESWQGTF